MERLSFLSRLPAEIQLMIAERIHSVFDIVSLSQCSRRLRAVVYRSVTGWLRLLQEGTPGDCFSYREMLFLGSLVEGKVYQLHC
jgi:hypothetical protein